MTHAEDALKNSWVYHLPWDSEEEKHLHNTMEILVRTLVTKTRHITGHMTNTNRDQIIVTNVTHVRFLFLQQTGVIIYSICGFGTLTTSLSSMFIKELGVFLNINKH
ncbi:hypothetical protein ACJX0J_022951, partial [Zea mays]